MWKAAHDQQIKANRSLIITREAVEKRLYVLNAMVRRRTASHVLTRRNRPGVSPTAPNTRAARHNGKAQWGHAGGGPVANDNAGRWWSPQATGRGWQGLNPVTRPLTGCNTPRSNVPGLSHKTHARSGG